MKFLRRSWDRYSKLGKGRKKKQKWKKPTGRDNKMREKKRGKPAVVSVGYKNDVSKSGKLKEKIKIMVRNIADLNKIGKENIAVIANIGKKKKIEIVKKAKEMKVEIYNLNIKTYLKKLGNEKNVSLEKSSKKISTEDKK